MTECSRCGDCCDQIGYWGDWNRLQAWADWGASWRAWAMENLRDGEDCGDDWGMDAAARRQVANAEFLLRHWRPSTDYHRTTQPVFTCDAFDPVARLCTAHTHRPPICQGFPWYGSENRSPIFSNRCAFWADVPLEDRPGGKLRSLPIFAGA